MKYRENTPFTTILRILLIATAMGFIFMFFATAVLRLSYPYELEWMEGGMVDHIVRILSGQPIYIEPTPDFAPYTYTPLYSYVAAGIASIVGAGFFALRLVALLGAAGCLGILYLFVKRESGSRIAGLLAAGLFAATYRASGFWFDVGRADTLFMFLALTALYCLRSKDSMLLQFAAGGLMFLSFFSKQTALFIALPIALFPLIAGKGIRRFIFPVTFGLLLVGSTFLIHRATDGWYSFYVFTLPQQHPTALFRIASFWLFDLAHTVPIAFLLGGIFIVQRFRVRRREETLFYSLLALSLVGAAWAVRMKGGSFTNTLIPAFAAAAIFFGLTYASITQTLNHPTHPAEKTGFSLRNIHLFLLACLVQFLLLIYDPRAQIPTTADREAGDRFVAFLSAFDNPVFAPTCGFIPTYANKNTSIQTVSLQDIGRSPYGHLVRDPITENIQQRRYNLIILDEALTEDSPWLMDVLSDKYKPIELPFKNEGVFRPVTGRPARPGPAFVRRSGITGEKTE